MKSAIITATLLLLGNLCAQTPAAPPLHLPGNVLLPVTNDDPIDVLQMKVGDTITLTLTHNILRADKSVAIPKGAKARGHITVVEVNSPGKESRFGFIVESIEWKAGRAELVAAVAPTSPPVFPPEEKFQRAGDIPLQIGAYSQLSVENSRNGTALVSKRDIHFPKHCRFTLVTE